MIAFLLDCAFKSTIVLIVAFAATWVLRNRSASLRHSIWSAAFVIVVVLPLVIFLTPARRAEMNLSTVTRLSIPVVVGTEAQPAAKTDAAVTADAAIPAGAAAWPTALWVWMSGAIVIAIVLGLETLRLARIAFAAEPFFDSRWFEVTKDFSRLFHLQRPVRLVQSRTASLLVTWGALQPRVLLPAGAGSWSDRRVRAVLGHELAHIRRHDWFFQLTGEIVRTLYWFNPMVWLACDRLRHESERACDDAALGLGMDSTDYAAELLDLARLLKASGASWATALAMARPSTLERRFADMLNPRLDRRSLTRKTALIVGLCALYVTLSVAAIQTPVRNQAGRLFGRVYDPNGTPIKNASITITSPALNYRATVTSNESGVFAFSQVPAGEYELQTSATGFEPFQIRSVMVEPNQEVNLNVMTVGAMVPGVTNPSVPSTNSPADSVRPKLIRQVPPVYPAGLKERSIGGRVLLNAVIGADGTPKSLRPLNGNVDPELIKAAIEAVKQWRYSPAVVNGLATETTIVIPIVFNVASAGVTPEAPLPPPPPPPPPPTGDQPTRIRMGGAVMQSKLVFQAKPIYPDAAREARISGVVILEAVIGKDGAVQNVRVITGHPLLAPAAVDAVSQWRYEPTLLNDQLVEVVTTITVTFSLAQ